MNLGYIIGSVLYYIIMKEPTKFQGLGIHLMLTLGHEVEFNPLDDT